MNKKKVKLRLSFINSPALHMNLSLPLFPDNKVFPEKVAPFFCTNDDRKVHFNGVLATTSAGHILAPTLVQAHIG